MDEDVHRRLGDVVPSWVRITVLVESPEVVAGKAAAEQPQGRAALSAAQSMLDRRVGQPVDAAEAALKAAPALETVGAFGPRGALAFAGNGDDVPWAQARPGA